MHTPVLIIVILLLIRELRYGTLLIKCIYIHPILYILCIYIHPITHLWWICDCYVCVYRLQTVSTNLNYLEYYALNCYRIFITERELIFYWIQHLYQVYQYICCVEFELFIILYILTVGFRIFCCSSPGNS